MNGKIFPPLMTVKYADAQTDQSSLNLQFTLSVQYSMDTKRHEKDIEITMATLCSFGVLWSALKLWSCSKRSGKTAPDVTCKYDKK
uniref:Uncharacterized protein n=1 Tax=Romanomermis culicivorax TaxID=13658 RepID=A0A915L6J3_ROMCU